MFYQLASLFHISVDQFFFPADTPIKTSHRRRLEDLLNGMDDTDLINMEATAKGIIVAKGIIEAKERRTSTGK